MGKLLPRSALPRMSVRARVPELENARCKRRELDSDVLLFGDSQYGFPERLRLGAGLGRRILLYLSAHEVFLVQTGEAFSRGVGIGFHPRYRFLRVFAGVLHWTSSMKKRLSGVVCLARQL